MSDSYPAIQSLHDLRMAALGLMIFTFRFKAVLVLLEILGGM